MAKGNGRRKTQTQTPIPQVPPETITMQYKEPKQPKHRTTTDFTIEFGEFRFSGSTTRESNE